MDIEGGHSWWRNRLRYEACSAQWRRTPGGRALIEQQREENL